MTELINIKYLWILILLFTVSCNYNYLEVDKNNPGIEIVSAIENPKETDDELADVPQIDFLPTKKAMLDSEDSKEITPTPYSDSSENNDKIDVNEDNSLTQAGVSEEKPLEGLIIGIDPGHQQKGNNHPELSSPTGGEKKSKVSSGTTGVHTGVPEYKVNLEIGMKLKDTLENLGAKVVMSRESNNVDISNMQRAELMNKYKVQLCIRLHCNGSPDKTVQGAMLLLPKGNDTKDIQEESEIAGEIIFRNFLASTEAKDAGIQYREDLTGFNWSTVPVCLLEMGYMSNPDEDKLLSEELYQQKCVEGITEGVKEWYKMINNNSR